MASHNFGLARDTEGLRRDIFGLARDNLGKICPAENYEQALQKTETAHDYFLAHEKESDRKAVILNLLTDTYLQGYNDDKQAETYTRKALLLSDSINLVKEKSKSLSIFAAQ